MNKFKFIKGSSINNEYDEDSKEIKKWENQGTIHIKVKREFDMRNLFRVALLLLIVVTSGILIILLLNSGMSSSFVGGVQGSTVFTNVLYLVGGLIVVFLGAFYYSNHRTDTVNQRMDSVNQRIDSSGSALTSRLDGINNNMTSRLDGISDRLNTLQADFDAKLSKIDTTFNEFSRQIIDSTRDISRTMVFSHAQGSKGYVEEGASGRVLTDKGNDVLKKEPELDRVIAEIYLENPETLPATTPYHVYHNLKISGTDPWEICKKHKFEMPELIRIIMAKSCELFDLKNST